MPKLRRVISRAKELPLTIEFPKADFTEGVDLQAVLAESKNLAAGLSEVWARLNGDTVLDQATLESLQRETKALLQIELYGCMCHHLIYIYPSRRRPPPRGPSVLAPLWWLPFSCLLKVPEPRGY